MAASKQFSQFIALMELIELLASRQTTESLSLRSASGEPVGRLTVEAGQVRFGVEHRGRVMVDEVFMREQPRLSVILRKILDRHSLARTERDLTWDISAIGRVSLCELTARALRKVAADCILPAATLRPPDTGLPQLRLLNVAFTPLELALAAGLWGNIRHEDVAVQLYFSPPVSTQERWLFEWQPNDPGFAWPILTDQLGVRRVSDVRLFGMLGHLLMPSSSTRRLRSDRTATSATLVLFDEGICFVATSSRYMTLLVYDRTHIARLLTAYEEFIENDSSRRPDGGGSVLLAGKVALAAGQHAATTVSGLRLASPGYQSATPSAASTGAAAAGAGESGRRASIAPRPPATAPTPPVVSAAPVAVTVPTPPAAAARGSTATTTLTPAAPSKPTAPPSAAPASATPPTAVAITLGAAPPRAASEDTPVAAGSPGAGDASALTPPSAHSTWPAAASGAPASAMTVGSSSTSAILAMASVGLGSASGRSVEVAPAAPAPVTRRSSEGQRESGADDWVLAAAELIDSTTWHAPAAISSASSLGVSAATPPAASKPSVTPLPAAEGASPAKASAVEPPGELLSSALLAATMELGESLPRPSARPQPSLAASVPAAAATSITPVRSLPPAVVKAPESPVVVAKGPEAPLPLAWPAVELSPPLLTLPPSAVTPEALPVPGASVTQPSEVTPPPAFGESSQVEIAPGPPSLSPPPAVAQSALTPPQPASQAGAAMALDTVSSRTADGTGPGLAAADSQAAVAPLPDLLATAGVPAVAAVALANNPTVAGVVSLGFPDLALLAALAAPEAVPAVTSSLADSPTSQGSEESAAADEPEASSLIAPRPEQRATASDSVRLGDLDETLASAFGRLADSEDVVDSSPLGEASEPRRALAGPVAGSVSRSEPVAAAQAEADSDLDELQFRLEEWSPVRPLLRREAGPEILPETGAETGAETAGDEPAASPTAVQTVSDDASAQGAGEAAAASSQPADARPVAGLAEATAWPGQPVDGQIEDPELEQALAIAQAAGDHETRTEHGESMPEPLDRLLPPVASAAWEPESAAAASDDSQPAAPPSATSPSPGDDLGSEPSQPQLDVSAWRPAPEPSAAPAVETAGPASEPLPAEPEAVSSDVAEVSAGLLVPPPAMGEPADVESAAGVVPDSLLAAASPATEPARASASQEDSQGELPLLVFDHFTARIDGRTILKDLTFSIEPRGVCAIMGPGGSGKSSLLGILGGQNRLSGGWEFTGQCLFNGQPLGAGARPLTIPQTLHRTTLSVFEYLRSDAAEPQSVTEARVQAVLQRVRLSRLCSELNTDVGRLQPALGDGEWWRLVIARALLRNPPLLCIDEPTAGLSDVEAALIIDVLKAEGLRRAVIFVTHNQQHARVISHRMLLLAGGRLQESETTEVFFTGPKSRAGQDYVRTGGCYVPSPDSPTDALSEEFQAGPALPPVVTPEPAPEVAAPAPPPSPPVAPAPARDTEILWVDEGAGKPAVLSLRRLGLRVGTRWVLHELSFDLHERGLFVLGVPDGMAKRMLVRLLCGPRPVNFHMEGESRYGKGPLSDDNSPATPQAGAQLLMMSVAGYIGSALAERSLSRPEQRSETVRLITEAGFPELLTRLDSDMTSVEAPERRVLEILRAIVSDPAVLVLDEPLAGLPPGQRERVVAVLKQQAQQRAVLILSSDAAVAAELDAAQGWVLEGRTAATAPPPPEPEPAPEPAPGPIVAPESTPSTAVAEPSPAPSVPEPVPAAPPLRRFSGRGPRGFQWLRLGALAGMPAPGLTNDLAYDLDLIHNTGISWLVTLTHEPLPAEEVARHSLRNIQFPIVDMDVPTEEAAARLCAQVAELVAGGQAVGFHCKAGLGRTGTMLACQLIWEGSTAAAALRDVRAVEPGWIQSEKQVAFLSRFEEWIKQTWPMEGGQRKKRKSVSDVHPSSNQGAQLTEGKEKSNDPT